MAYIYPEWEKYERLVAAKSELETKLNQAIESRQSVDAAQATSQTSSQAVSQPQAAVQ